MFILGEHCTSWIEGDWQGSTVVQEDIKCEVDTGLCITLGYMLADEECRGN